MQNDIKLYYDLTAQKTADEWYQEEILKPTLEEFINLFTYTPRILDFGCGTGHESMRLAALGASVKGVDFSEECIRIAKERTPQCEFQVMDFRNVDEKVGIFDGIIACASLIHINPKEMPNVLKNMRSIVKLCGYVSVIIKDGEGIQEDWSVLEVEDKKLERTVYLYSKALIEHEAHKVGFSFLREGFLDVKLTQYGWKNYIFKVSF